MELNLWIAFGAGFASFISPCCLPLYPSYLSYITGFSVSKLKEEKTAEVRLRTLLHTLFFTLGFSVVFYSLGFGAGILAEWFTMNRELISKLTGILIVVMGLFLLGIFQPQFLMKERKLQLNGKPAGYFGSFVVGIGFAAGWSPCIGPILAAITALAATEPGIWLGLITAYTIGFALPFLLLAFFIGSTKWILRYSSTIMKIGGAVMVIMGILLYTGQMFRLTIWFTSITPDWLKF
ncbi:cytochrome c biogenesis CcdA family protein [Paenibacillus turpanensis]|uniref:cytochrome c biogenesis CcdA family protein n=1 Tax=Paenibacillus turpanensis TaxID=2689078 RepID=UPI00140E4A9E|nr:cytochrome c biogenesis protein CcdA [Paenibacillus turpanensis]